MDVFLPMILLVSFKLPNFGNLLTKILKNLGNSTSNALRLLEVI